MATRSREPPPPIRTESPSVIRILPCFLVPIASIVSLAFSATAASADPQPTASAPAAASTSIELNKLESTDKGCRTYLVINNPTDTAYQSFKIDLVLFQTDGVIGRRLSVDLAPLRAQKKSVKLFEIDAIACNKIGSLLINDVLECKSDAGPVDNCLQHLQTSTLTSVQLSK
jgi:hypothetical protein